MGRSLLFALLIVPAGAALADTSTGYPCRYRSEHFDQGAIVCIHVGGASRLARCDMQQNVASWTFTGPSCSAASLAPMKPLPGGNTLPAFGQPLSLRPNSPEPISSPISPM